MQRCLAVLQAPWNASAELLAARARAKTTRRGRDARGGVLNPEAALDGVTGDVADVLIEESGSKGKSGDDDASENPLAAGVPEANVMVRVLRVC